MKATDQLLKDHKMIRKVLDEFHVDNSNFSHLLKTAQRIVIGHAWFEDEIFLPAFKIEPLLEKRFTDEIIQEHKDIDTLFSLLRKTSNVKSKECSALTMQLKAILSCHLKKEEDALFPMAELILNTEGLNSLGDEMERRKSEVRGLIRDEVSS